MFLSIPTLIGLYLVIKFVYWSHYGDRDDLAEENKRLRQAEPIPEWKQWKPKK